MKKNNTEVLTQTTIEYITNGRDFNEPYVKVSYTDGSSTSVGLACLKSSSQQFLKLTIEGTSKTWANLRDELINTSQGKASGSKFAKALKNALKNNDNKDDDMNRFFLELNTSSRVVSSREPETAKSTFSNMEILCSEMNQTLSYYGDSNIVSNRPSSRTSIKPFISIPSSPRRSDSYISLSSISFSID